MPTSVSTYLRPLVLDLEGSGDRQSLRAFAALGPGGESLLWRRGQGSLETALSALEALARDAEAVVAHNGRAFDLPKLARLAPKHRILDLPLVDTLELSPLAFPRNPYHRLVKGYKLVHRSLGDPVEDCRLCLTVLADCLEALASLPADELGLLRRLLSPVEPFYDELFRRLGGRALGPEEAEGTLVDALIHPRFPGGRSEAPRACRGAVAALVGGGVSDPAQAYLMRWMSTVDAASSILPRWVWATYDGLPALVEAVRGLPCADPACGWCRSAHDLEGALERHFGHPRFRVDADGGSIQRDLVSALMDGRSVLGVLPTGGGKSLCYQLPALLWSERAKRLTVVISPLQSLMKDQVDGLRSRGIASAAALYGGLTPPERQTVMDQVARGDVDLLYVSPEQLRNRSFQSLVSQRQIAAWIIDEAHCLSKWGHDFRPDYLYIGKFLAARRRPEDPAPIIGCFTATARPEVLDEIAGHFRESLGIDLERHIGSAQRDNLRFVVLETSEEAKIGHVVELLRERLRSGRGGAAIVYASTRKKTDRFAEALKLHGLEAESYHAGRDLDRKRIQDAFLDDRLEVIVATNAFGMGVDKPNVRLVVHADIPGSLEAYLQEAGRAGRDRRDALCILLYNPHDVETQFRLQGLGRLSLEDLKALLQAVRRRAKAVRAGGERGIFVTAGELLRDPETRPSFDLEDKLYDTKVKTALHTLEQAGLLSREENRYQVFQGRLLERDPVRLERRIADLPLSVGYAADCLTVARVLLSSADSALHNTDALSAETGLDPEQIPAILKTLKDAGLTTVALQLTALVRVGAVGDSRSRLGRRAGVERAVLDALISSPDLPGDAAPGGEAIPLDLRRLTDQVREAVQADPSEPVSLGLVRRVLYDLRALKVWRTVRRSEEHLWLDLFVPLNQARALALERQRIAARVLEELVGRARGDGRGDVEVSFTTADLGAALASDLLTQGVARPEDRAVEALLWLHDAGVIVLQGGLAVLRPAMHLRLPESRRRVRQKDYEPLAELYERQVIHVHVMDEFARLKLEDEDRASRFVSDYFTMGEDSFLRRWFPGRQEELTRATHPDTYDRIVTGLKDPTQRGIVESQASAILVLAGPGSGKTRVVVHRAAWLVKVRRVDPREVLILAFNRSVAIEVRRRLGELADVEGRRIAVHTLHSLAMAVVGIDLEAETRRRIAAGGDAPGASRAILDEVIPRATELLRARAQGDEAGAAFQDDLLVGWRYIFVDEYQDIGEGHYELIRALTGAQREPEDRLTLMAVGDDDQAIYGFTGADVGYIRRFKEDYHAEIHALLVNHRSTPAIVEVSQALIGRAPSRMKAGQPVRSGRTDDGPPVRIVALDGEAAAVGWLAAELGARAATRGLGTVAVLAPTHEELDAVEVRLQRAGLAPQRGRSATLPLYRRRAVRRVLDALSAERLVSAARLAAIIEGAGTAADPAIPQLLEMLGDWRQEVGEMPTPATGFVQRIYEAAWEDRRDRRRGGSLVLSTLHAAKGLEFDTVLLLAPTRAPSRERRDEARRLLYVGMTRARTHLTIIDRGADSGALLHELRASAPPSRLSSEAPVVEVGDLDQEALRTRTVELSLADINLGWPARTPDQEVHRRITGLGPGDRLELRVEARGVEAAGVAVLAQGRRVGRLSKAGVERLALPQDGLDQVLLDAEVADVAVIDRRPTDEARLHRDLDRWEVVVPRLTLRRG